jgi:hypothetical protein
MRETPASSPLVTQPAKQKHSRFFLWMTVLLFLTILANLVVFTSQQLSKSCDFERRIVEGVSPQSWTPERELACRQAERQFAENVFPLQVAGAVSVGGGLVTLLGVVLMKKWAVISFALNWLLEIALIFLVAGLGGAGNSSAGAISAVLNGAILFSLLVGWRRRRVGSA